MAELKTILQKAIDTLENKINDLSTISVTTLTGDVSSIVNGKNEIHLEEVLSKLTGGTATGNIELVAHTEIKFDNDAILYVKKEFSQNDEMIFNLHQAMIDSAIESRKSFIEFIANVIKKV